MASQLVSLYMLQLQQNAARQEAEIARNERQAEMDTAQINQAFQMSIQSTNDYFKAQQAMDNRDLELMREKHKWDMAEREDQRQQQKHRLEQARLLQQWQGTQDGLNERAEERNKATIAAAAVGAGRKSALDDRKTAGKRKLEVIKAIRDGQTRIQKLIKGQYIGPTGEALGLSGPQLGELQAQLAELDKLRSQAGQMDERVPQDLFTQAGALYGSLTNILTGYAEPLEQIQIQPGQSAVPAMLARPGGWRGMSQGTGRDAFGRTYPKPE